ncbi:hypothetical protein N7456_012813 [Penicillium angulare]|uniref:Protein trafficking Pga2 n=1 Tax=Penicillium angulare TaxID=116970 RepID=A0A9W9JVY9_9EURO|nr:hypothetical protein N7456_012813 [Penicillium angulare]
MAEQRADMSDVAAEAAADFFHQVFGVVIEAAKRFYRNVYNSVADAGSMGTRRWAKVIGSVVFYIIIRPYIEKFFKYLHDRQRAQEKEKKEKEKAARSGKKAKVSANSLRGGTDSGQVLGEVDNTDDELEDGEENLAQASGVPEWNNMARKRQKKYIKNLRKQGQQADEFSEEQIMEMLDWSDDEEEKKAA